jgi:hypothetical protein
MKNFTLEQLVQLRTKMILEKKDINSINLLIESKELEYSEYIKEDGATGGPSGSVNAASVGYGGGGVAYANAATGGMGAITAAQPANTAGVTTEPGYTSGGGKTGSGDIGVPYNAGGTKVFQKVPADNRTGASTNRRRKNKMLAGLKSVFAKRQDFTASQGKRTSPKVMNFNDFQKDKINTVTKIDQ